MRASSDPSETQDLAKDPAYKEFVTKLVYQANSFKAYVDGTMSAEELEDYDCVANPTEYWHNFDGPCCKKKKKEA